MSLAAQVRRVWFLALESDAEWPEVRRLSRSAPLLSLKQALALLRRRITPDLIVILAPPGAEARDALAALRELAPAVVIGTLSFWSDELALRQWANQEVRDSLRRRRPEEDRPPNPYGLSARESEILRLMVKGLIKKEIAVELSLSFHTVDNHQRRIFQKLNVHTRSAAVAKAILDRLC